MAVSGNSRMNVLDLTKQSDPDGKPAKVAEVMVQINPLFDDMPMFPSNAPTGHQVTMRSSLPTVSTGRINQGVARSKSTTRQVVDTLCLINGSCEFDERLRDIYGANFEEARWGENRMFIESITQKATNLILYGNENADDSQFTGIITRYNSLSGPNAAYTINAGGSGSDNTSIVIVDWEENYASGIHSPSAPAGIKVLERGSQRVTDIAGNPFYALTTDYRVNMGITIKDPAHVARVCNIDVSDIQAAGNSSYAGPNLLKLLTDAMYVMKAPNGATRVIYAPNVVLNALDNLVQVKANLALAYGEWHGQPVLTYRGFPMRRVDQFSLAETKVT